MAARRYLSRAEVAERIGVKAESMSRYRLPAPDAVIGRVRGWLPATIDRWQQTRPGPGWWGTHAGRPRKPELPADPPPKRRRLNNAEARELADLIAGRQR